VGLFNLTHGLKPELKKPVSAVSDFRFTDQSAAAARPGILRTGFFRTGRFFLFAGSAEKTRSTGDEPIERVPDFLLTGLQQGSRIRAKCSCFGQRRHYGYSQPRRQLESFRKDRNDPTLPPAWLAADLPPLGHRKERASCLCPERKLLLFLGERLSLLGAALA
jgi:hypothetical protein